MPTTAQVIRLSTDALTNKTKDLQLAAWLTEALLKQKGFGGLRDGLALCYGLVEKFWETVYPELEDGDAQARGAPLGFIGTKLEIPLKLMPVVEKRQVQAVLDYQQSREVATRIRQRPTMPRKSGLSHKGRQACA